MSHKSIMAQYRADLAAAHEAATADQIVEGLKGAYRGAVQSTRASTPRNPTSADLHVYAQSLRANVEQDDNPGFLARLLGL